MAAIECSVMPDRHLKPGDVLTWAEVSAVHKTRSGICHRNGLLISLLTDFGRINPCYPDFEGDTPDLIHYTGSGRRGDQKLDPANRALLASIGKPTPVPLFNKLSVNRWHFVGTFQITASSYLRDAQHDRMVWRFTLQRVE
jgi:hypothetical protein